MPQPYTIGIDQYFLINGSVAGIVVGGSMTEESEVREMRGIGSFKPQQQREGLLRCHGSVTMELQGVGHLTLAKRDVNGYLPVFNCEGGGANEGQRHNDCKIDTLTLEGMAGGELRTTLSWKGLSSTTRPGNVAHSPSAANVLEWYQGDIAGIAGIELLGFTISISHNVDWLPTITSGQTPQRSAKYLPEKQQVVVANLRLLARENVDLMVTNLPSISSVTIVYGSVGNRITMTLDNLKRGVHERPYTPVDIVEYGVAYSVEDFDIS